MCIFSPPEPKVIYATNPSSAPTPPPSANVSSAEPEITKGTPEAQREQEKERFRRNESRKGFSALSLTGGGGDDEVAKTRRVTLSGR